MSISKRDFSRSVLALSALLILPLSSALAGDIDPAVNADANKVAIQGYDPVSYFTVGHPEKGSPENEVTWRGTHWWFSSKDNSARFSAKPESYAPRFGGFCAGAMAANQFVKANPEAWAIVDGKLYMYWEKPGPVAVDDPLRSEIAKAEENWKTLHPE